LTDAGVRFGPAGLEAADYPLDLRLRCIKVHTWTVRYSAVRIVIVNNVRAATTAQSLHGGWLQVTCPQRLL
jgi:hypothetical protein